MRLRVPPRATAGRQGGHRSPFKSVGVEFTDHRPYVSGDDFRHIDWKAFARHGQLVIRQFEEEKDAFIHILLDVTGSMGRGRPAKIVVAQRLAASFAYVGMRQFDRVRVMPFADELEDLPLAIRGPQDLPALEKLLIAAAPEGPTNFAAAVHQMALRGAHRGLVIVITDLMAPEGWDDGFRHLGAMGHELSVIHIGCAEDEHPTFNGELELRDAETDERVRLRVDKALIARYREEVKTHFEGCRESVRRAGGRFVEIDVSMPTDAMLKRLFGGPRLRNASVAGGR